MSENISPSRNLRLLLISFFTVVFFCRPLAAESERILSFFSDITVNQDSSLTVQETIRVKAAGDQIKHGIFREFPLKFKDQMGYTHKVGFKVLKVSRDGSPEDYHYDLGLDQNATKIYIGHKEHFVPPGEHSYTLIYRTTKQLGFYSDHDELYWNVTGNKWSFPIDQAGARVFLPAAAAGKISRFDGFTGPVGSQAKNLTTVFDNQGNLVYWTTRALALGEGLTIVVGWPKGLIQPPGWWDNFQDQLPLWVAFAGILIVFLYYLFVWKTYGIDPQKGVIIPLFEAPEGLSPAAVRFINRMDYDDRCFTAALISLAVKGYLQIKEYEGDYVLVKIKEEDKSLPDEESKIFNKLFLAGKEIELNSKNSEKFRSTADSFQKSLRKTYENFFFVSNRKYFYFGLLYSVIFFWGAALLEAYNHGPGAVIMVLFFTFWLTLWNIGVLAMLTQIISGWVKILRGGQKGPGIAGTLFLSFFSLPFIIADIAVFSVFSMATSFLMVPMALVLFLMNYVFYHLIKKPTVMGRDTLNKIEGLKMYLETAEKDRLNALNPPEKNPELFEKFLPFALALDVEQKWGEQFTDVFSRASGTPDQSSYHPGWYQNPGMTAFSAASFASVLSGSFAGALSSANMPVRSGSGFGGGGGSGGGGGGGGGGGW